MGLAVISVALFFHMTLQEAGFPDGHITDLERAHAKLYPPFIVLSIICGLYFFYIGITVANRKIRSRFLAGILAYLLISCITGAIDVYLTMTLDDGAGG
jgi:H+/Cl- antiporter ClcA